MILYNDVEVISLVGQSGKSFGKYVAYDVFCRVVNEYEERIKKMKCCGNCKHWHHEGIQKYCVATKPDFLIKRQKDICDKWEQAE